MESEEKNNIELQYRNFIIRDKHPCVMATALFKLRNYQLKIFDDMTSDAVLDPILKVIESYLDGYDFESNNFESLLFCFKNNHFKSEMDFEVALWDLLQKMHDRDVITWDSQVSDDVESSLFSFSLKGRAFYIIGMHPNSSRLARTAPYCTMVLNLHWQFEKLREMGIYTNVKTRIRRRDKKLQGSINPMLRDFGTDSEARQYSGRAVEKDWKCPFHLKTEIK